jgi:hypothetical protein
VAPVGRFRLWDDALAVLTAPEDPGALVRKAADAGQEYARTQSAQTFISACQRQAAAHPTAGAGQVAGSQRSQRQIVMAEGALGVEFQYLQTGLAAASDVV